MDKKTDINKVRQKLGMVFQHFNLFPHKNVLENITLAPTKLKKLPKETAEKKAMELLGRVGAYRQKGLLSKQAIRGTKAADSDS